MQKPKVIFLHGSPGNKSDWDKYAEDSDLQRNFELTSILRPGYRENEKAMSLEDQSMFIGKNLRKDSILIGYSYSGALAARLAMDFPEKVKTIIFIAPSLNPEINHIESLHKVGNLSLIHPLLPQYFKTSVDETFQLENDLKQIEWNKITARCFALYGKKDSVVSEENNTYLKMKIPDCTITLLEDEDHNLPWNNTKYLKEILMNLLNETIHHDEVKN